MPIFLRRFYIKKSNEYNQKQADMAKGKSGTVVNNPNDYTKDG